MSLLQRIFGKKKENMVLQCLSDISLNKYYSSEVLTEVLRGKLPDKVKDKSLENVEGFGKLKELKREDIEFIIRWLIDKIFILETREYYPVLHPTYEGVHYGSIMNKKLLMDLKQRLEGSEC